MVESNNVTPIEYKVCSGKYGCGKTKPVTDFYVRTDGGVLVPCKDCKRNYQKHKRGQVSVSRQHERDFVAECRDRGIVADLGKWFRGFSHVDAICFGSVRVEIKLVNHYGNRHRTISFSLAQQQRGLLADVVVVMISTDNGYTYHMFDPQWDKFYKQKNGKRFLKTAATLLPDGSKHQGVVASSITAQDLLKAQNQWHLLYPASIQHLVQNKGKNYAGNIHQLSLFGD